MIIDFAQTSTSSGDCLIPCFSCIVPREYRMDVVLLMKRNGNVTVINRLLCETCHALFFKSRRHFECVVGYTVIYRCHLMDNPLSRPGLLPTEPHATSNNFKGKSCLLLCGSSCSSSSELNFHIFSSFNKISGVVVALSRVWFQVRKDESSMSTSLSSPRQKSDVLLACYSPRFAQYPCAHFRTLRTKRMA